MLGAALFTAGQRVIFAVGVPWLAGVASLDFSTALAKGFLPFIPGGLLKAAIAGLLMPLAWRWAGGRLRQRGARPARSF